MPKIIGRFYAELNDFLPRESRFRDALYSVPDGQHLSDFLSSNGVPAGTVDLILCNGTPVSFQHVLSDGDRLSFYPVFESFDIHTVSAVRAKPLRDPRFILDVQLGKLASFLRMLGFDTLYYPDSNESLLLSISLNDGRTLLSRDKDLLRNESLTRRYRVVSDQPREQTAEVIHRFDLASSVSPFTRCIRCNTLLEHVEKNDIINRLPPKVQSCYTEFFFCPHCDRLFWKGSHYETMKRFVEELVEREAHGRV